MMVFRGEFDCTMDEKGRIKMPASFRKKFPVEDGGKCIIAKDLENCLAIYPIKVWDQREVFLNTLNPFDFKHRRFRDIITAGLTEVEMDGTDRFLVTRSLIKYLGNGKDVVMIGKDDYIQVWDATKHSEYLQSLSSDAQDLLDHVAPSWLSMKKNEQEQK
jgi:transcriptional regulator MraZ